jgi:hypothetical protein
MATATKLLHAVTKDNRKGLVAADRIIWPGVFPVFRDSIWNTLRHAIGRADFEIGEPHEAVRIAGRVRRADGAR